MKTYGRRMSPHIPSCSPPSAKIAHAASVTPKGDHPENLQNHPQMRPELQVSNGILTR